MLKLIHIVFILTSFGSFIVRMALSELKPEILQRKLFKIAPHVIDTLLLLTGIVLVFQGRWLEGEYGWIISKFLVLLLYVIFGVTAMRHTGAARWLAFVAAIACFAYIFVVAISKQGFI